MVTVEPALYHRSWRIRTMRPPRPRYGELHRTLATIRQQGRRLLNILVAAEEAVLQGTPAPSRLPTAHG